MFDKHFLLIPVLAISMALTACGGSSSSSSSDGSGSESDAKQTQDSSNYTNLDAASDTTQAAYLDLASGHTVTESESWQMAYQKYVGFKVNSEVAACIAKSYPALFDADGNAVQTEFESLTKDNTLADFEAVTSTSCTDFEADTAKSQFEDWYTYNSETHVVTVNSDDSNGWILRSATKDDTFATEYNYARIKVKSYDSNGIVLTFETYDHNTDSFTATTDSAAMDFSSGAAYWDMETNQVSTTEIADWDLKIVQEGYGHGIYTNGGVSGAGDAGVAGSGSVLISGGVDAVTDPADTTQVYKYFEDSAEGALSQPGNYGPLQYSVAGQHKMWPTFTVYLFKDGDQYYKAQVVSNYGEEGTSTSGNLYIRYDEVTE